MGISGPPEKGKTPLGTEEKGKRFYPILGVFSPLYWEKLPKGITKVITTTEGAREQGGREEGLG